MSTAALQHAQRGREALDAVISQQSIPGHEHLKRVYDFCGRFVCYPNEHARVAHALWIAHAHLIEEFESTPRLAFLSPEPGSGKTRALEITQTLVPSAVEAVNATPAYIFRRISSPDGLPTILFDEIDTIFGPKAKDNEELRGIINAGHRKGAMAGRCVVRGKEIMTEELPAYCALAVAGLGALPDTILSRSVIVRMRRRAPGETVEPYRRRLNEPEGNRIRDGLEAWARGVADKVRDTFPEMPAGVEDRAADVWEPLLAIADAAGGDWPTRARTAASEMVKASKETTPSLGVKLLEDLRSVFSDRLHMTTDAVIAALTAMPEAPWGDMKGRPIDARRLSKMLHPYGVKPKTIREGNNTPRGYVREDLHDPWARYLPPPKASTSETSTTSATEEEVIV